MPIRFPASIAILILSLPIFGQERPEPEFLNVAYLYDSASNKLIGLERQNAKPAAKAKAFGYGGIKATSEVPGDKSPVRFPSDRKLVFVFRAPPGLDPQSLIEIVRLTSKKDHREVVQMQSKGFLGLGGVKAEGDKADVPFDAGKYSETSLQVSPVEPLAPGEYAIHQPANPTVFCFGIDPTGKSR
jgi:hypothetical protein